MSEQLPTRFSKPSRDVAADARAGLGSSLPPHISLLGGRFALVDAGGERYPWPKTHIDVVIFDANKHKSKRYYPDGYDADNTSPPVCFSDNGEAPSANAQDPQARTCHECPKAAWNSAVSKMTGKGIPACQDRKKFAVYVVDDKADMAYLLDIPPTSLKASKTYSDMVCSMSVPGGARSADLPDVITRISFSDQAGEQFQLKFETVAWINDAIGDRCDELFNSGVSAMLVNKSDKPFQGALPPPPVYAQVTQQQQEPPPPNYTQAKQPEQQEDPPSRGRGGARAGAGRKPKAPPLEGEVIQPGPVARDQGAPIPDFLLRSREQQGNGATETAAPHPGMKASLDAAMSLPIRK
jgi:hypothetical protein